MDDQKEQDRIRRRAYEMWEREGSPEGRAEEFWQKAISSLEAEDTQGAGDAASSQPAREAEDKDK
ncbi:hypothetical protein AWB80_00563 [Caballeronia pedi]|uniref:DUF2934 domain-containing protein n=1 Tax=Caballeronia pedi TaxID=1777141 RepID=A0A157ZCH9_9BURK|nr:DUF2934 domain-containing protein [Caballeronia pedi]SAK43230.1 hypothetical protein AWB80_00563 [Caballeronia pedi]